MTKKIWRLLCIFSVFLAGILLYEGGVLVFRFQARREGLLTCFAGGCAAVFYLAAFQRSGREQGETKVKVWKMILVEGLRRFWPQVVRCMSAGIRIRDCNTGLRELY